MVKGRLLQVIFWVLRLSVSGFFLVIASKKLLAINKLQADIEKFDLFPVSWAIPLAYLGLACEFVVALGLLWRKTYAGAALIGSGMTAMFVTLFTQGWIRGLSLSCNCLGVERAVESYPFEIGWRLCLMIVMLLLLWDAIRRQKGTDSLSRLDFSNV